MTSTQREDDFIPSPYQPGVPNPDDLLTDAEHDLADRMADEERAVEMLESGVLAAEAAARESKARMATAISRRSIADAALAGDYAGVAKLTGKPLPSGNRFPPVASNDNRPSPKRDRFEVTFFDDIEEETPKVEILEGVLGEGEFTDVIGKPGSGKSVIVTDMACHIAAGMPWHGRAVRKGLVVYFAAERRKLTLRRMAAFRKHHGVSGLPLAVFGGKLDMTSNILDAAALSQAVRGVADRFGTPCVWVIIDTLSRTFGGGDQNASKDMGKYVQSVDEIHRALHCHVTVIHHSGWGEERGKGAIDLDGAVDSSFYVRNNKGNFTLVCDGTNDGEPGPVTAFKMQSVEVGPETTAPVVIPQQLGNLSGAIRDFEPAKPTQRDIALEHLLAAVESDGVEPPDSDFSDGARVVKEETWRERCYAAAGDATPEAKKKSFQRAKSALLGSNLIRETGQWVWPT